jgi:two-component system response regulator RegX3
MSRILIIEDEPDIAQSLKYSIEREEGFVVRVAPDGERGLSEAQRDPPDLVLLDLSLPGTDGMEVCRALRRGRLTSTVPVIMLTARVEERDKIAGLEVGADDYVTKPFSNKEVVARIRAVLRRARTPLEQPSVLVRGELTIDEAHRRVTVGDVDVALTRKEFDLLAELCRRPGIVWTREQLLARTWGYDHPGPTRTVDVHVRQLRKKLGLAIAARIETVVGVGYRFRRDEP